VTLNLYEVENAKPVIMQAVPVSGAEQETEARVVNPDPENAEASIPVMGDPFAVGLSQLTVTRDVEESLGFVS
jgi:hypothetical protein